MEVRLFAMLRDNRGNVIDFQWRDGLSGHVLLNELGIKEEDAAIFLVNGMHSKFDKILHKEDIIAIFPPIGGG